MNYRSILLLVITLLIFMILLILIPWKIIGAMIVVSFICIIAVGITGILRKNDAGLIQPFTTLILKSITAFIVIKEIVLRPETMGMLARQIPDLTVINYNPVFRVYIALIVSLCYYFIFKQIIIRNIEVIARFTLDSLPGKRMEIDSNLENGNISREEADEKISLLESQTNKTGAIDGFTRCLYIEGRMTMAICMLSMIAVLIGELYTTGIF
jgi:type III secretory pathway component EscV